VEKLGGILQVYGVRRLLKKRCRTERCTITAADAGQIDMVDTPERGRRSLELTASCSAEKLHSGGENARLPQNVLQEVGHGPTRALWSGGLKAILSLTDL
jgi:hypothetical protein